MASIHGLHLFCLSFLLSFVLLFTQCNVLLLPVRPLSNAQLHNGLSDHRGGQSQFASMPFPCFNDGLLPKEKQYIFDETFGSNFLLSLTVELCPQWEWKTNHIRCPQQVHFSPYPCHVLGADGVHQLLGCACQLWSVSLAKPFVFPDQDP